MFVRPFTGRTLSSVRLSKCPPPPLPPLLLLVNYSTTLLKLLISESGTATMGLLWINMTSRNPKEKSNFRIKPVSIVDLFRYGSWYDTAFVFLGLAFAVICGTGVPLTAWYTGGIVTLLLHGNPKSPDFWDSSVAVLYKYVITGFLLTVFSFLQYLFLNVACLKIVKRIKIEYLQSILQLDAEWFDRRRGDENLNTALNRNIAQITEAIGDKLGLIIRSVTHFGFGLFVAFSFCWQLATPLILVAPFLMASTAVMTNFLNAASRKEEKVFERANMAACDAIRNSQMVAAYNAEEFETKQYKTILKDGFLFALQKGTFTGMLSGVTTFMVFLCAGFSTFYGTFLYQTGVMREPGDIFAILVSVITGAVSLAGSSQHLPIFLKARLAAAEIYEVINTKTPICSTSPDGLRLDKAEGTIEFQNVTFRYPLQKNKNALSNFSLKISAGERIALVGEYGSGKSTVAALVSRIYDATEGKVLIGGRDIRDFNVQHLRRDFVASVQQEPIIFNDTIAFNLRQKNENITVEDMIKVCRMANIYDFIQVLPKGFDTVVGDAEGCVYLSAGQKQRLAIARTLLRRPKILVLDEATSAMDAQGENLVRSALFNAIKGRTTIAIAHRISAIQNLDKIVVMANGSITEVGTHKELLALKGHYYSLVEAQKKEKKTMHSAKFAAFVDPAQQTLHEKPKFTLFKEEDQEDDDSDMESTHQEIHQKTPNGFGIVRSVARRYFTIYALGLLFCIAHGYSIPVYASLIGNAFTSIGNYNDALLEEAETNFHYFIAYGLIAGISAFLYSFLFGAIGERIARKLRVGLLYSVLHQDGSYFDAPQHKADTLSSNLSADASNCKFPFGVAFAQLSFGAVSLIVAIVFSFRINPTLALVCSGMFVIQIMIQLVATKFAYKQNKCTISKDLAGKTAVAAIEHIRTVQLLTLEQEILNRFIERGDRQFKQQLWRTPLNALNFAVNNGLQQLTQALSYVVGFIFLVHQQRSLIVTPLNIFKVVQTMFFGSAGMAYAVSYLSDWSRGKAAANKLFSLVERHLKPKDDDEGLHVELQGPIVLSGVSFAYPSKPQQYILRDLNLIVEKGKSLVLVGPAGSGKRTIFSVLQRYYQQPCGEVKIGNILVESYALKHLRNRIGYVGQSPRLFFGTISENITYGFGDQLTPQQVKQAAVLANANDFIQKLPNAYDTVYDDEEIVLSESQKRRIAIARAVVRNPPILLIDCDEGSGAAPTCNLVESALDTAMRGRTCLRIAHHLGTAEKADQIAFIENGKVRETGTPAELMQLGGRYCRYVKARAPTMPDHTAHC